MQTPRPIGEDQAAALGKRGAEGWFFGERLAAGIDHFGADLAIGRPARNQSPAEERRFARTTRGPLAHRQDFLSWRDIQTRLQLQVCNAAQIEQKLLRQDRKGRAKRVAATHGKVVDVGETVSRAF